MAFLRFGKSKDSHAGLGTEQIERLNTQADLDSDGLPPINRGKKSGSLINFFGLVFILGVGATFLYSSIKNSRAVDGHSKEKKGQVEKISNNLPPLVVPSAPPPIVLASASQAPATPPAPVKAAGAVQPIPVRGQMISAPPNLHSAAPNSATSAAPTKAPIDWTERKMNGPVLIASGGGSSSSSGSASHVSAQAASTQDGAGLQNTALTGTNARGGLAMQLEPAVLVGSMAGQLPDRNFLITKGSSLSCVLETALDSTVPGMTTCRLTRDIYSDNGQVLLLDRGSNLVGEYQGGLRNGQARLFVIWTRAKTPTGVIVNLNSPGTDSLGRSGLEGWVDTHFIDRFGAALLISTFKDSYAYLIAKAGGTGSGGSNGVVYANTAQTTDKMGEKALEATVNIPPTLMKNQGEEIQIMVARDLDFSSVYGLKVKK